MSSSKPTEAEASYRAFVKRYSRGEQLSSDERKALDDYRAYLKLSPEKARAIVQEVLGKKKSENQPASTAAEPSLEKSSDQTELLAKDTKASPLPFNISGSQGFNPSDEETRPPTPPPGSSEEYLINVNRYKEELRRAIRSEGLSLSPETTARLSQRAKELNLNQEDAAYLRSLKQYTRELRQAIQIEDLSPRPGSEMYLSQRANQLRLDPQDIEYLQAIENYRRDLRRSVRLEGQSLSAESKDRLEQLASQQKLMKGDVEYVQRLVDCGQDILQVLRSSPYDPADEAGEQEKREHKQALAKQYRLDNDDARDIDEEMLAEYYLNRSVPPDNPPPPPAPPYDPQLVPLFEVLEGHLKAGELENADIATQEILLKVIAPPRQTWIDAESLAQEGILKKNKGAEAIREVNRLWTEYSKGKFGFSRQLAIYKGPVKGASRSRLSIDNRQNRERSLAFSKRVGWWIRGLEFFKPYRYLNFTPDAPDGHLPAYWFWHIPRSQAGQLGNLWLLPERGGCAVDAFTIPAFMDMVERCGVKPAAGETEITAIEPTRLVEKRQAKPDE